MWVLDAVKSPMSEFTFHLTLVWVVVLSLMTDLGWVPLDAAMKNKNTTNNGSGVEIRGIGKWK